MGRRPTTGRMGDNAPRRSWGLKTRRHFLFHAPRFYTGFGSLCAASLMTSHHTLENFTEGSRRQVLIFAGFNIPDSGRLDCPKPFRCQEHCAAPEHMCSRRKPPLLLPGHHPSSQPYGTVAACRVTNATLTRCIEAGPQIPPTLISAHCRRYAYAECAPEPISYVRLVGGTEKLASTLKRDPCWQQTPDRLNALCIN